MLRDTTPAIDPTQLALVKAITANIEQCYNALLGAATNINGLIDAGTVTCADIKAYNVWAITIYGVQQTLLQKLQALNVPGTPDHPTPPTLFGAAGVDANDMNVDDWTNINCDTSTDTLNGALAAAMAPPNASTVYLSRKDIQTITSPTIPVGSAPDFATLSNIKPPTTLGIFGVDDIIVAGVVIFAIGFFAVKAIGDYFQTKAIQEQATARNANSLIAYQNMTASRLACVTQCMGGAPSATGPASSACTNQCASLIPVPALPDGSLKTPPQGLGTLGTVGLIAIAAAGGIFLFEHYKKKNAP